MVCILLLSCYVLDLGHVVPFKGLVWLIGSSGWRDHSCNLNKPRWAGVELSNVFWLWWTCIEPDVPCLPFKRDKLQGRSKHIPTISTLNLPTNILALHLPTCSWYTDSVQQWSVKVEKSHFWWQSALRCWKERSPSTAPVLSELAHSEGEAITLSSRIFFECYLNKFRPSSTLSFIFWTLHWHSSCYHWVQSSQLLFTRSYDESFFLFLFFSCYRRRTGLDFLFQHDFWIFP